jgi:DNA-binding PadR family transcriptional regulator
MILYLDQSWINIEVVEVPVTTKAALLQVLLRGPGYGSELGRILRRDAPGIVDPRPGSLYPALQALVRKGCVRRWTVVPGGARGARSRSYYELTARGMAVATAQRHAFLRIATPAPCHTPAKQLALMRERIRRGAEVSEFALRLRDGVMARGQER